MITDKLLKELKSNFDLCASEILRKILYGDNKPDRTIVINFKNSIHLNSMIGEFNEIKELRYYYDKDYPDYCNVLLMTENNFAHTTWSISLLSLPENAIIEIIHAVSNYDRT